MKSRENSEKEGCRTEGLAVAFVFLYFREVVKYRLQKALPTRSAGVHWTFLRHLVERALRPAFALFSLDVTPHM